MTQPEADPAALSIQKVHVQTGRIRPISDRDPHATLTARYYNRRIADRGVEGGRKSVADPQSPTFGLHETTQQALGPSHQFPRTRSEKRDLSDDSQRW